MSAVAHRGGRDRLWPLAVVFLLAAMIGGCAALAWIAALHPDALVADDPWRAEIALREETAALMRGRALGLDLQVDLRAAPDRVDVGARVSEAGRPSAAVQRVLVRRERPAEGGLDAEIALFRDEERWRGSVPLPRRGRWLLTVRAATASGALVEKRVQVEADP